MSYALFCLGGFFLQKWIAEMVMPANTGGKEGIKNFIDSVIIALVSMFIYSGAITIIAAAGYLIYRKKDSEMKIGFGISTLLCLAWLIYLAVNIFVINS